LNEQLVASLVAVAIIILVAFPVHEFSHAYTAFRLGDNTARYQGRLTLNPIVHFDPLGGILLIVSAVIGGFFIGWGKPTPVNPFNLRYGRRGDALVSAAGPLSNLLLAVIVAIPLRIILANQDLRFTVLSNDFSFFVFSVAVTFVDINIMLMIFNLLPIPPLDGWHVLLDVVSPRTAYTLRQFEQYGFILILLFILVGAPFVGSIFSTIESILLGI